ncbi:PHD domain-containing protein [Cryptosporidium canis]|nr:PHD domain-containing protein [Cryptosporidium canis]
MQDTPEIFRNKYHMKCRFTRLTYCTCTRGNQSFHYSGDGEFKSMFEKILPSPQIHDLFKLLADSNEARIVSRSNTHPYKHIEKIVAKEREEFNRQYEKERKRIREANLEKKSEITDSGPLEASEDAETSQPGVDTKESENVPENSGTLCCAEDCSEENSSENLIKCSVCHKCFHYSCCSPGVSEHIKSTFPWTCSECISCAVCKRDDRPNSQVFCSICGRCFHISCLNPKLQKATRAFRFCDDCKICSRCHQLVDFPIEDGEIDIDSLPEGFDYLDPTYETRICYECRDDNKDLTCEVCNNALSKSGNRICSLCRMCVHSNCINAQICNLCTQ